MDISLKTMTEDAVIYADSEELNGFAVWLPLGFTGSKTLPFLMSGGVVNERRTADMLLDEFRAAQIGRMTLEVPKDL